MKLPMECVLFRRENVEHVGGERKGDHELRKHLRMIPADVELKEAVTFSY